MSRIILKNLPKNVTENTIRELFGQKGTITDIQLKYTPEGKFRRFGFVGYQNENEADEAIQAFDKTFINTSKISVEKCVELGDEKKPKAWSKYAPDSTAFKRANEVEKVTEVKNKEKPKKANKDEKSKLLEKYKDDPQFEEFLQVHAPQEIDKLHKIASENEDSAIDSSEENVSQSAADLNENTDEEISKVANEQISDLEYMKKLIKTSGENSERKPRQKTEKKIKEKIDLFTVKLKDLPYNIKKKDIKLFFKPLTLYSIRIPRNVHGFAYVGFKTEKLFKKALMKDRSFINGKRVSVVKYSADTKIVKEDGNKNNSLNNKWKNQAESLRNEEDIAESGRIFIRNLAYTTTEEDVEKLFSQYGPLTEVNLPIDSASRKMKGFGTITFLMPEHAVKAYSELDGSILHGRMVHLLPGKSKDAIEDSLLDESTNYKKIKSAQQKAQAGSSHNWNSLFLGHDAVADVIADTYATTKEAVVGPEGKGSAAVRLALGETQIVAQTRKYLEQEGVILDAFTNVGVKRSKTIILVKNLPCRTERKELYDIFKRHGELGRIILPPSGITAIVEFLEPSEARKAFTKLAYSKFKNVPLYLEWAPENSLKESKTKGEKEVIEETAEIKQELASGQSLEIAGEDEDDEEPEPDTTLFVKNLNFKTTNDGLRKHFEPCGKIRYANVATKKDPNDPKRTLSMGYGFVQFRHKASADKALKALQQSVLDEKSLELKRSERTLRNEVRSVRKTSKKVKQTGTKILVRNVPFQATRTEIQELFSTFGEIKALRLPKKMDGSNSHRGFAFIDYSTASDAKNAFEALCQSTHLFGRRLVLEWASGEEGVEELRKRTADHFTPVEEVKSKKSIFSID